MTDPPPNTTKSDYKKDPKIAAQIHDTTNPEPDQHNNGQPLRSSQDARGQQRSKFFTDCSKQHAESLQCIEEHYENKDVACRPFFDAYKTCRHEEHKRKMRENARLSGGGEGRESGDSCVIS